MSYILDALRRADSERERGSVPGIHAQPVPVPSPEGVSRGGPKPWVWVVIGVSLGLLVPLLWLLLGQETPAQTNGPAAATTPPPPIPVAPERRVPEATAAVPAVAAAPPAAALPDHPIERRPTSTEVVVHKPAAPAASAVPAAGERVYARNELPDEIRRQLPTLAIGGSTYSPNPANRFLLVNGLVVHEKGELGPEHVLEQIRPKSAVLRFKGYRYEIDY